MNGFKSFKFTSLTSINEDILVMQYCPMLASDKSGSSSDSTCSGTS